MVSRGFLLWEELSAHTRPKSLLVLLESLALHVSACLVLDIQLQRVSPVTGKSTSSGGSLLIR